MQGVWLDRRAILYQSVENMNRLPDAARNEGGEQCYITVRDVMIRNTSITSVPNVLCAQEIVFPQWNMRPVSDCRAAGAPKSWQGEAVIGVDKIGARSLKFVHIDMPALAISGV
jgi:hypothetical protein